MKSLMVRITSTFDISAEDVEESLYENYRGAKAGDIEVVDLMKEPATREREPDEY